MSSTAQKWLLGCGIGCGVVILLIAMVIGGGVWFARGLKGRFDTAASRGTELATRFGEPSDWTPPADGAPPAARIELFLAVRDSLQESRARFDETFAAFRRVNDKQQPRRFGDVLSAVRGGMALAPLLGEFYGRRNSALNSVGMGLGEYIYIYALGYYAFLGKPPEAGPRGLHYDDEERDRDVRPRLHRQLLAQLRNELDAVEAAPSAGAAAWRDTLAAEVARLERDDRRLPWADGLPPAIAAAFAPYRDRFAATWSDAGNVFELTGTKGNRHSLSIEN
ncbi:MAG: hypothetical protein ACYDIE_06410 [Candidatus Krumholzibacteriia bacterium]